MRWMKHPLVSGTGLAVLVSIAVSAPALAQDANGSAGTGGRRATPLPRTRLTAA